MQQAVRSALTLSVFSLFGAGLLATAFQNTNDKIVSNTRAYLAQQLAILVPKQLYDNDLTAARFVFSSHKNQTRYGYRASKNRQVQAIIVETVAPDGYSGDIVLLVAVDKDTRILGVRVVMHKETPGLGDAIEIERSNWITRFNGKSIQLDVKHWKVKRDLGTIDQITSATITSRAIATAVWQTLQQIQQQHAVLFAKT